MRRTKERLRSVSTTGREGSNGGGGSKEGKKREEKEECRALPSHLSGVTQLFWGQKRYRRVHGGWKKKNEHDRDWRTESERWWRQRGQLREAISLPMTLTSTHTASHRDIPPRRTPRGKAAYLASDPARVCRSCPIPPSLHIHHRAGGDGERTGKICDGGKRRGYTDYRWGGCTRGCHTRTSSLQAIRQRACSDSRLFPVVASATLCHYLTRASVNSERAVVRDGRKYGRCVARMGCRNTVQQRDTW